jgi:hypothetical protein
MWRVHAQIYLNFSYHSSIFKRELKVDFLWVWAMLIWFLGSPFLILFWFLFFWKMPLLLTALPMIFFTGGYITVTLNNEPKYSFRWRTGGNCLFDSIKDLSNIVQKPLKVRVPKIKIHHSLKFSAILNFQENWTEIWEWSKNH